VIERFASPAVRLLTRASADGATGGAETLELTHEALIEKWRLLQEWLNSDRDALRFQRRLEEAARHWQEHGQQEGSLWRPPGLDLLERFREDHDAALTVIQAGFANSSRQAEQDRLAAEQARLEADQAQRRRDQRTKALLRSGLVALSGLTVLALGAGGFAWHQLRQAEAAQALQFEATHRALLDSDPFSSLVYGLAVAKPLLDGRHPWEAAQLSDSLTAVAAKPSLSMPIATGQGRVWSLIELKNGELISGGDDGTLRRWALRPVVATLCRSFDLNTGTYPPAMAPAREAARQSCRQVGVFN
jgi:hypothetical protein